MLIKGSPKGVVSHLKNSNPLIQNIRNNDWGELPNRVSSQPSFVYSRTYLFFRPTLLSHRRERLGYTFSSTSFSPFLIKLHKSFEYESKNSYFSKLSQSFESFYCFRTLFVSYFTRDVILRRFYVVDQPIVIHNTWIILSRLVVSRPEKVITWGRTYVSLFYSITFTFLNLWPFMCINT